MFRGRVRRLDKREKTLVGVALILLILAVGSYGTGLWRGDWQSGEWDIAVSQGEAYYGDLRGLVIDEGTFYVLDAGGSGNNYFLRCRPYLGETAWDRMFSGGICGYTKPRMAKIDDYLYVVRDYGLGRRQSVLSSSDYEVLFEDYKYVYDLEVLDGTLYMIGGYTSTAKLSKYTPGEDTDRVVLAESSYGYVYDAEFYEGTLYGVTAYNQGNLVAYTPGVDTEWRLLATKYGSEGNLYGVTIMDGTVYATSSTGRLLAYTIGVDTGWRLLSEPYPGTSDYRRVVNDGTTIYAGAYGTGELLAFTPGEDTSWRLLVGTVGSNKGVVELEIWNNTLYACLNGFDELFSYRLPPQESTQEGGDTPLSVGAFWVSPSQPRAGDTVSFKLTGEGITRARVTITVNDPFNGVNTTSHYMSLTGDTWWHKETYPHPCSVVATARVWGADGSSQNSTTLSFSVLPEEDEEPETPVEAVAEVVEEVSQAVEDWMISSVEVAGYEIPLWLPSLILLALSAGIWRRRR